jgi:cbb3-type cytochrome c oxidase subunit I
MAARKDATVRLMVNSAIVWLVIAITYGLLQAIEFIAPDSFRGIAWLVFPRIRQAHVNGLAFGWLSMAMVAGWYYIVPRLTKTDIHSEKLGIFVAWAWNIALAVGVVGLTLGWTQAREYAELAWPVDMAVMGVLILSAYNLFRTIMDRKEPALYVSLWYVMGTLLWFPIVYAIGNVIWAPPTGSLMGLNDAIWNWFYGHNVLGLWFTTGTAAIIYFIVPRETKRPIYGYGLALIAFWGIAFFYTAVGTHHILGAPVPEWLKTISIICSLGLLIPVSAFVVNMFMTMRGSWRVAYTSIPLRFVLTGVFSYLLVSIQGSFQALRGFNQFIHFTNWPVAHAHLALLGFVAFSLWGMVYYMMPRILGVPLYSERLAWTHWWLTTIGFIGFFTVLTSAGLVQAAGFAGGIPIIKILPGIHSLWVGRAASGAIIIFGQYIFAYNILRTALEARKAPAEKPATADAAPAAASV